MLHGRTRGGDRTIAKRNFSNLRICYLSSRIDAGFAGGDRLNVVICGLIEPLRTTLISPNRAARGSVCNGL